MKPAIASSTVMRMMSMQKLRPDRIRVSTPFIFWLFVCTDFVAVSICTSVACC